MSDKKPLSRIAAEKCAETQVPRGEGYYGDLVSEFEPLIASVYVEQDNRIGKALEAFRRYGKHGVDCNITLHQRSLKAGRYWEYGSCNCGLSAAIKELEGL